MEKLQTKSVIYAQGLVLLVSENNPLNAIPV